MIRENQTTTLKPPPALASKPIPLPRQFGLESPTPNAKSVLKKHAPEPLALFQKAREYKSAARVRELGLYPYFRTISSAQDTEVTINGRRVLMMGSNSYLGLTNHPVIKEAVREAVLKYGTGCAGSRFLNGTLDIHLELEESLARLVNKPAALVYSTGFQVNLGVISVIAGKGEYILADKSNHASLNEGCLLSPAQLIRFAHNDTEALEKRLAQLPLEAGKLIVVDGVFSMEGDITPLVEICRLAEQYGAAIMVDDAHAIGVLGRHGAGTAAHFNLADKVPLIMGTFSKSLASVGGFIAADVEVIDYLKHNSRTLIFSASISPANAAAVQAALRIMIQEPERIANLWRNTARMKAGLLSLGFDLGASESPILPLYCRDQLMAFQMCKRLEEEAVFVNPVVPPGVPPGKELIRLSLMATHTDRQIDFALEKLSKVGKEVGLI
jgi:8-amino-7-oxononanoate synthase